MKMKRALGRRGDPAAPLPMTALVGYLDQVTIKDAIAHAKGFAKRRFEAADASWYAVMPFDDGFLYEVHEGGAGHGYLAGVAAALSQDDVPTVWIPSGSRACQITMRDGRPLGLLLSEADSATLRESDIEPLPRSGRMRQVSPKGTGVLTVGTVVFLAGLASLTVGAGFHFLSSSMIASAPRGGAQLVDAMPHRQWPLVDQRPQRDMHAAALRLQNGHWIVDWVASPVAPQENTPSGTAPLPDDAIIGPSSPETEMPDASGAAVDPTLPATLPEAVAPSTASVEDPGASDTDSDRPASEMTGTETTTATDAPPPADAHPKSAAAATEAPESSQRDRPRYPWRSAPR